MSSDLLIFDAHLDLSMNAMNWNRDLTQTVHEIRRQELESGVEGKGRGKGTVALPDMRRGKVGLCVATQIGHCDNGPGPLPGWHSPEQAWAQTQGQLAWYRAMEKRGEMVQIRNVRDLKQYVEQWTGASDASQAVGYILSLEGADSIVDLHYLERSYGEGLRALGPAHYGPGRYAFGTDSSGPLNSQGRELLKEMDRLGMILDVTHLCDECFREAMDLYQGPVWASHHNCRALVDHNRQFSDEQFKALIERGAMIGAALDAWMLYPGWIKGVTTPEESGVNLEDVADHIDHVCQLAGNARHCGIGSDLDGGFGTEQSPLGLDTIADLQEILKILAKRGYSAEDIRAIAHGNFLRFLEQALPED